MMAMARRQRRYLSEAVRCTKAPKMQGVGNQ